MTVSPKLALPYLEAAQSQKHVTVNESLRLLDAIVQLSVKSMTVTSPPGSPANGDAYIVPASATGAWAGWDGSIALYADTAWLEIEPGEGWIAWVQSTDGIVAWNGTAWGSPVSFADIPDSSFSLADNADATKKAKFELSGISTGTTRTMTLPNADTALAGLAVTQTFTGQQTLGAASNTISTGTSGGTTNIGTGATASGNTKVVNIGTAGASGSTTNIAIGSAVAGALGTLTINSPTVTFGSTVSAVAMASANLSALWCGLGGATADATNRFSINSPASLFNHAGAGHQLKINKNASGDTASILMQDGFSGRLEIGLTGSDDTQVKVSNDGSTWFTALQLERTTGRVRAMIALQVNPVAGDYASPADGDLWYNSTTGKFRARQGGTSVDLIAGGGGTPGGSSGQVQYNNGGAFDGAADVGISGGQLALSVPGSTPAAPSGTTLKEYGTTNYARPFPHFMRADGIERPLAQHPGLAWRAEILPVSGTAAVGSQGFATAFVGTSTASAGLADTNAQTRAMRSEALVTTGSTSAIAGLRGTSTLCTVGGAAAGRGGFFMCAAWGPATGPSTTSGTLRAFCGLSSVVSAPTDVNPSTLTNIIGMGADAGDTNWQLLYNDGSGTASKIDLGASFPKSTADRTDFYQVILFSPPGTTQVVYYEITNLSTGAVASGSVTTDLPSTTTFLGHRGWCSVGGTSSVVGYAVGRFYLERPL